LGQNIENGKQHTMKTINKALDVLQLFLNCRREMALGEVAKLSGINKTTLSRILSTLKKRDYIKQPSKRGNYSLGPIYLGFSGIIKNEIQLRKIAMSHLAKLASDVHESVIISCGNGLGIVFTEIYYDPTQSSILKVVPEEGISMPLHATSSGKILLANMSEKQLEKYFRNKPLKSYTPNTIVDLNTMKNTLLIVRQEDVAQDNEEFALGVRGLGTGIRDGEGKIVGAIAILAPSVRLSRSRMRQLVPIIKNCANDISRELGF
jgi:DNA-binding IclR family transcriptional regulator